MERIAKRVRREELCRVNEVGAVIHDLDIVGHRRELVERTGERFVVETE